jgi:hypothetical protein
MIFHSLLGSDGPFTPPPDIYYPIPGTGTYRTAATALSGINYSVIGVPAAPTGGVTSPPGTPGLLRQKFDGNFCASSSNTVAQYNLSWFDGKTPMASITDTFASWGQQSDGPGPGQHNFSIYWQGYINVIPQITPSNPTNWNFYVESDDTCALWIGSEAIAGFNASNCLVSSQNKTLPNDATSSRASHSLTMDPTKYYPILIWFSEFTGGCKFQLYAQGADGTKLNGNQMSLVSVK